MEKKRKFIKPTVIAALAVIAVVVLSLIFSGCATPIVEIHENGEQTIGGVRVSVNVPTDGASEYNVHINTSDADYSGETLVETVERIRPAVVDVYASSLNASYAGSGVIVGGVNEDEKAVALGASAATAETAYDQYYIITNHHVIDGCNRFSVDLLFIADDDTETHDTYTATLVGGSPARDIAVLRIERKGDEKIVLADIVADSDKIRVGTEVIAIGNPLGILGGTVTKGIVSATAREVKVGDIGTMTLMQTDTAINGGNSGGGLFDTSGRLIGIVNSGYETDSSGASVEGLNFAIPANDALYAGRSLIETYSEANGATVQYGYVMGDTNLGLKVAEMNLYESQSSQNRGYYIVGVTNTVSGPLYTTWQNSYKALISVTIAGNNAEISTLSKAQKAISSIKAGDEVIIEYKDVMITNDFFHKTYLDSTVKSVTVTAEQYIYTV